MTLLKLILLQNAFRTDTVLYKDFSVVLLIF